MTTRLCTPFLSLSLENFISRGAAGQVYFVTEKVVFKCPIVFENAVESQVEEMAESARRMENEKNVYQILMEHRHPNIVCGILCVPEGLFMERQETTLESRIKNYDTVAVTTERQERWIQQLSSALSWIEGLGYAHGDLRPANIFLDAAEDVRVGDFDAAVKKGEQLQVASEPFCRVDENYEPGIAGPLSEQFAIASCIYNIRFGRKPFHDVEPHERVRMLMVGNFPATTSDTVFGDLMSDCWQGRYKSMGSVELSISRLLGRCSVTEELALDDGLRAGKDEASSLRVECEQFLGSERQI